MLRAARAYAVALLACANASQAQDRINVPNSLELTSWTAVTVGVADLDAALSLWVDDMEFTIAARQTGPDAGLAELWGIAPDDIRRQALLRSEGASIGMLHLVEFDDPDPPVRAGAAVFDSLPKNLDVYVVDMPARLAELADKGHTFRNDVFSEVTAPSGVTFREMHMPVHDDINVVLLEVVGDESLVRNGGFAGIGPLITVVDNAADERAFFAKVMAAKKLSDNVLEGPDIEKMVGLPPGAALDVSIWGRASERFGQIEIIEYRGVEGENRYARARPKSRGVLHVSYSVSSLEPMRRRLDQHRVDFGEHGVVETLYGSGAVMSFHTPAGLRIELHERRE